MVCDGTLAYTHTNIQEHIQDNFFLSSLLMKEVYDSFQVAKL